MAEEEIETIERRAESLVRSRASLMRGLVAMRKKHCLTQEEVAERMGVSQATVSAFERYDSNPTLASITRYALAVSATLNIDVVDDCLASSLAASTQALYWPPTVPTRRQWSPRWAPAQVSVEPVGV